MSRPLHALISSVFLLCERHFSFDQNETFGQIKRLIRQILGSRYNYVASYMCDGQCCNAIAEERDSVTESFHQVYE